jgi:hypothetical protein
MKRLSRGKSKAKGINDRLLPPRRSLRCAFLGKIPPNVDKLTGPGTRMGHEVWVVLTSPPFNLRSKMVKELCRYEVIAHTQVKRTRLRKRCAYDGGRLLRKHRL